MENWNRYLGDYYYPHTYVQTNNFGEVTRTTEERAVGFHFKEGYICQYVDVGLKFTGKRTYRMDGEWNEEKSCYSFVADEWKESDKAHSVDLYSDGLRDVHLEKYECTAVTGTLYVLEVAPEASRWILATKGEVPYVKICIGDEEIADTASLKYLYNKLNP